jgi:hypothetical protein
MRSHPGRTSAYRRLEKQLKDTQDALGNAATAYTEALQALIDTIAMLDASGFGAGRLYRCLTPLELERLDEIRTIACGPPK